MVWTSVMRRIAGASAGSGEIDEQDAYRLFAAMLDDGVTDLELGAILAGLQVNDLSLAQLLGFHRALMERCFRLVAPKAAARPVVLAGHDGTREQPNLLPLIALLLRRFSVPVLVHGALDGSRGTTAGSVLRELGVMPCAHLVQAEVELIEHKIAFVPTALVAPGLAKLASACVRLGFGGVVALLARLVAPFSGASLLGAAANGARECRLLGEFLEASRADALLLDGTEGEAFADPLCRPKLQHFRAGERRLLFDAEAAPLRNLASLPHATDAASTASWIRRVMTGEVPLPLPLANQIACCLYGADYTNDLNQAKAIAAIETGSLAVA
jgi:anthranilate phosphoribosyltransferase